MKNDDYQDKEDRYDRSAKSYYESHTCSLNNFSDLQLQDELTRREDARRSTARREAELAPKRKELDALLARAEKLRKEIEA